MASGASAARMVDAELGTAAHVAPTTPIRLQGASAAGTGTTAGTALANPTPQTITFAAASVTTGVAASSNAPTLTNTSGGTVTLTGVNLIDSAGTPRFLGYGGITGGAKTLNNNDAATFAVGQVQYGVTPSP